jgi:hypothetical protein
MAVVIINIIIRLQPWSLAAGTLTATTTCTAAVRGAIRIIGVTHRINNNKLYEYLDVQSSKKMQRIVIGDLSFLGILWLR